MTRNEAFSLSREKGIKITHRYFTSKEYIIVSGNIITTEEGYTMTTQLFNHYKNTPQWETDWEEFKSK